MAAVYPSAAWADDVAKVRLTGAYWRRRRLEARLLAAELAQMLAGAGGQGEGRMATHEAAEMWFA
jgi:hypothetical protein